MPLVGLTRATTIDLIDELVEWGLIGELPNARESAGYRKGRPARRFELNAHAGIVAGVDAGRNHITVTLADLRGRTIVRRRGDEAASVETPHARRAAIADVLAVSLSDAGRVPKDLLGLCIGVPAPVDRYGDSPEGDDGFWALMNPSLREHFAQRVPLVRIDNDASLAAVAEKAVGAAVGVANVVVLLAGERLGAGVVIDGRLTRGARGGVGELIAFDFVRGVDSAWGLGHRLAEEVVDALRASEVPHDSPLFGRPSEEVDARLILEAADAGDPFSQAVRRRVARTLARIAGVFGSMYDPDRVVVAGAIADGAQSLVDEANALMIEDSVLPHPEIVASLLGGDVVSMGAVAAAVDLVREGVLSLPRGEHGMPGAPVKRSPSLVL